MAYEAHLDASKNIAARCAIVTLSDTRTLDTDSSGERIADLLKSNGHAVAQRDVLPDNADQLKSHLARLLADDRIDAIITSGGTGISRRDQTINVIEQCLTTPLPGFGELFRMLSYQQIQSGAMLSRAIGGIAQNKPLFALPGSTKAVELAMEKLILPELKHLLAELRK